MQEANLQWRYIQNDIILPWYTKSCLEFLLKENTKEWRVFEYGAGYSTIWWRLNCLSVKSVDNNKDWALLAGAEYQSEKDTYLASIFNEGQFDCVIVDGIYRQECVEWAIPYLKQKAIIIIDNYRQDSMEENEWDRVDELLEGWTKLIFKQYNHTDWQTAVFIKPEQ